MPRDEHDTLRSSSPAPPSQNLARELATGGHLFLLRRLRSWQLRLPTQVRNDAKLRPCAIINTPTASGVITVTHNPSCHTPQNVSAGPFPTLPTVRNRSCASRGSHLPLAGINALWQRHTTTLTFLFLYASTAFRKYSINTVPRRGSTHRRDHGHNC